MAKDNDPKAGVISTIKEWAAPTLIGIVGMLVWRDVTELRTDVKLLLYNQSANEVKIHNLEEEVKTLRADVLTLYSSNSGSREDNPQPKYNTMYAIKEDDYKVYSKTPGKKR